MKAITPVHWLLLASACAWLLDDVAAVPLEHTNLGIYGGSAVDITEVPYMAQLLIKSRWVSAYKFWCGASIIHKQFLVTAEHCRYWGEIFIDIESWKILVGSDKRGKGQEYEVDRIISHPDFDHTFADYDIAVIKLKKELTFSDRVKPIIMTDSRFAPNPGDVMESMGFGKTAIASYSEDLLTVQLLYENRVECQKEFKNPNEKITERMICTETKGKDPCNGDSGGPLVYKGHLIGVVSLCVICGETPAVYTYITPLRSWVEETIKNTS